MGPRSSRKVEGLLATLARIHFDTSAFLLLGMHLAVAAVFIVPFSWGVVAFALGSYLLRMFAITAGYHRLFSHRAYKTSRAFQLVLAVLGTASMQNGPLWWASWHRVHHRYSDTPRDLRFLERHKWLPIVAYAVGCFLVAGWAGLVWGFVVSTIVLFHATLSINSLAHVWGARRYQTGDDSRNNPLLAILTLGEGWHNNHHHCMVSARQGFFWWEVDISYYVLRALAAIGVVWDLRSPTPEALHGPRVFVPGRSHTAH